MTVAPKLGLWRDGRRASAASQEDGATEAVPRRSATTVTALRRFEFSASRRIADGRWSGDNFIGWAAITGDVDRDTGMIVNMVDLKAWIADVLEAYDHRGLEWRLAPTEPTTANVARALWRDVSERIPSGIHLAGIVLREQMGDGARVTRRGAWSVRRGTFSAAHRTYAPALDDRENERRFGICSSPAGHGHNYRVEIEAPADLGLPEGAWADLDHRNLSVDVPAFAGRNASTEAIALLLADRVPAASRVRVYETDDFFAEVDHGSVRLGRRYRFRAAHRLESPVLTAEQNRNVFGKCNRPDPHGHTYVAEILVEGPWDPVSGTAGDLDRIDRAARAVLGPLDHAYLDRDVTAFRKCPSTGENIARWLHERLTGRLGEDLVSVRLSETPNNDFIAAWKGPDR